MTKEEITEGNKLIAQFMGYKYYPHPEKESGWRKEKGYMKIEGYYLCRRHSELRYFNSWDWLMPVIEKIHNMTFLEYKKIDYSIDHWNWIAWHKISFKFEKYELDLDNEEISLLKKNWIAVVEFIKFYNKENDQTESNNIEGV